jgi:hypothetical protein
VSAQFTQAANQEGEINRRIGQHNRLGKVKNLAEASFNVGRSLKQGTPDLDLNDPRVASLLQKARNHRSRLIDASGDICLAQPVFVIPAGYLKE